MVSLTEIRDVAAKLGLEVHNYWRENQSTIIWTDYFVLNRTYHDLKIYQKINHFPGMIQIARKDCLARNMAKIQKHLPRDFNYTPKTWILPEDYENWSEYDAKIRQRTGNRAYIIKPASSSMGRGIQLIISSNGKTLPCKENFVVQEYIENPLLMDGYKFDLRIFVLVTSYEPLSVFVCDEAIVRTSSDKYATPREENINEMYMHLTNTSVNKKRPASSSDLESNDVNCSRPLSVSIEFLEANGYDFDMLWKNIEDIIVKTIILSSPFISIQMESLGIENGGGKCFEILGLDVLIDSDLRPWLLEVNVNPYLGANMKMDYDIKCQLLEDTIKLVLEYDFTLKTKDAEIGKSMIRGDVDELECPRFGSLKRLMPTRNTSDQSYYHDLLQQVCRVFEESKKI